MFATATEAAGAFRLPSGSRDAVMIMRLDPGAYTVALTSLTGKSGEGLIEVYVVDP
jgi:hypothetical protein